MKRRDYNKSSKSITGPEGRLHPDLVEKQEVVGQAHCYQSPATHSSWHMACCGRNSRQMLHQNPSFSDVCNRVHEVFLVRNRRRSEGNRGSLVRNRLFESRILVRVARYKV